MIDFAQLQDVDELESLARRCFDEMDFSGTRGYQYNRDNTLNHLVHFMNNGYVIKATENKITGFMAVSVQTMHPYHLGEPIATEVAWHSDPELPKFKRARIMLELLEGMQKVLKFHNVNRFQIGAEFNGSTAIHKLLTRMGYKATCLTYAKEL